MPGSLLQSTNLGNTYNTFWEFTQTTLDTSWANSSTGIFTVPASPAHPFTTGDVMYGYYVQALPTPTRARLIQFPLFCFDSERDRLKNIMGFQGYALGRLQSLEQMEAQGETVIIQDFTANGEPIEAVIEQVTFTRTTPPNGNFTGWGGIIQITARTVV